MFWKYNNPSSSEIEALLQRQDVTLHEVMDCEDIINDCRSQKKLLIDFLLKSENIEELVNLITKEPSMQLDEGVRFKYPNIACELLTSDVPAINERLASEEVLLDKLYSFLESSEPPLNPLLASYFSKIMGALIAKKTEQVLDFLKAKDTFISLLLKHLGTSAIMDLTLKLMTQVENVEMRQNILNWLDSQRIMQSLVELLNRKIDKERHYNVAQLLCDFLITSRDTLRNSTIEQRIDPDPLLNRLESGETISLLLDHIFDDSSDEKSESAIVGGIKVLLTILDINQMGAGGNIIMNNTAATIINNSSIPKNGGDIGGVGGGGGGNSNIIIINDEASSSSSSSSLLCYDIEHKENVMRTTIESIRKHLKNFHKILLEPPKKLPIKTSVCYLDPPLGNTRLQVVKLFAAIISTNHLDLLEDIIELNTFTVILDLFFKYPWNNFLHTQVENCLVAVLKISDDKSNALIKHLLVNCKLIERLLNAWKENEEKEKSNGIRQGYMGHLICILNELIDKIRNTSLGEYLRNSNAGGGFFINELENFEESTLKDINLVRDSLLGGVYPNMCNENTDDYIAEVQFQEYTNQQQLPSHLIDGYSGFDDDAFNDSDDILQTDTNFDIYDDILNAHQEHFKQLCSQTVNTFNDSDDNENKKEEEVGEEEEEEDEEENNHKNQATYNNNSSDSDDDDNDSHHQSPPGIHVQVSKETTTATATATVAHDNIEEDPWKSSSSSSNVENNLVSPLSRHIVDPWASTSGTISEGVDNFDSVKFDVSFENAFPNTNEDNNISHAAGDYCPAIEQEQDESTSKIQPSMPSLVEGDNSPSSPSIITPSGKTSSI